MSQSKTLRRIAALVIASGLTAALGFSTTAIGSEASHSPNTHTVQLPQLKAGGGGPWCC